MSAESSSGLAKSLQSLAAYVRPRPLIMLALGASSGLPLLLTGSTLSAWLTQTKVDIATIGYLSWIAFAFTAKWMWSPLVDHLPLPLLEGLLGRRRGWLILSQAAVAISLAGLAFSNPGPGHLGAMIAFALLVAFASATQDIVVDAWRIEAAASEADQGVLAGAYQFGYRLGMFAAGAGALLLADILSWKAAYLAMAALTALFVLAAVAAPRVDRPQPQRPPADAGEAFGLRAARKGVTWFYTASLAPLVDFAARQGLWPAAVILATVACYRMPDTIVGVVTTNFYLTAGFTNTDIATIVKIYGFWVLAAGAVAGGWAVARWGMRRALVLGALVGAASNGVYAWLALQGPDLTALAVAISIENFAYGFATTILVVFMSSLTSAAFTATQFAIFSSFYKVPGVALGGFSGDAVQAFGFFWFFVLTAMAGAPALVLSFYAAKLPLSSGPDGRLPDRGRIG
jgi:PAT family beta-lactamase induction signal transducer AmpG